MGKCHSSTVDLSAGSVQPLLPPPLPSPAAACQHTASVLHGNEGCGGVLHSDWGQREEGERAGRLEGWKVALVCIVSREERGWIALRDTQFPEINAPSLSSLIYPFSPFSLPLPPSLPSSSLPPSLPSSLHSGAAISAGEIDGRKSAERLHQTRHSSHRWASWQYKI